jgi:hypothetical protein
VLSLQSHRINILAVVKFLSGIPPRFLITAVFGLLLALNTGFGELTYIGDGVGWDGRVYADLASKFYHHPATVFRTTPFYYLQRILPSEIIAIVLKVLNLPCDYSHIIFAFRWYNFTLLSASVYVWTLVSERMQFSRQTSWLSAILLFVSFPVQKQYIYFPVNTDATALFLSVLLFYFFIARYQTALLLVAGLGAFCWPMIFYSGLVLAIWPLRPIKDEKFVRPCLAALVAISAVGFSLYCFFACGIRPTFGCYLHVLPLSITITTLLILGGFRTLIPGAVEMWNQLVVALKTPKIYILFAVACGLSFLLGVLSIPEEVTYRVNIWIQVLHMSVSYLAKPGISLLACIVYFGPAILFALYCWSDITKLVKAAGLGMLIIFSEAILQLLLDSESRKALVFLPMLIGYTAKVLGDRQLSRSLLVCTVALSVLFSETWLLFNYLPGARTADIMNFPLQAFMCHFGSMNSVSYVVYGAAALVVGFLLPLYWPELVRSSRPAPSRVPEIGAQSATC